MTDQENHVTFDDVDEDVLLSADDVHVKCVEECKVECKYVDVVEEE